MGYHGANVNSVKEENGLSPLHVASKQGHFEVCKYLMTHGANVNKKTKHGLSAYDLAKSNGHILLADFFVRITYYFLKIKTKTFLNVLAHFPYKLFKISQNFQIF